MNTLERNALKAHLRDTKKKWIAEDPYGEGDTETGFITTREINFDALVREIDAFTRTFKS
jgi:hypothetical protein